jgi:anti-anti-sigma factor
MELTRTKALDATVVCAAGALSHRRRVGYCPEPLAHLCGMEVCRQTVFLGLSGIRHVDGSGLAWLLECAARFKATGGRLILFDVPPAVLRPLRLLGMDSRLAIAPDLSAAKTLAQQVAR